MLSERQDDDHGSKQWTNCRSSIAAHLKDRLCQTLPLLPMPSVPLLKLWDERPDGAQTYDAHSQENQKIILGKSQQEQAYQGEAHAEGKSIRDERWLKA